MTDQDLLENLSGLLTYIQNVRVEAYNEGVDAERERCASIAEHLNGWGSARSGKERAAELAAHIAKIIRDQPVNGQFGDRT